MRTPRLSEWFKLPSRCATRSLSRLSVALIRLLSQVGYTHLDTAAGYGNEEAVGSVVRASGKPREHFHVTTKLADHFHVAESFEASYKALNLEYIDLWLMHWPQVRCDLDLRHFMLIVRPAGERLGHGHGASF